MQDRQPEPFVGSRYASEPVKTFIFGESHYYRRPTELSDKAIRVFTSDVVANRIDGEHRPFFGVVERIVGGEATWDEQHRRQFWECVGFANFVPRILEQYPDGATEKPGTADYASGMARFKAILEEHSPDLVIFFSAASWHRRPWGEAGSEGNWPEVFGFEPEHVDENITRYPTGSGGAVIAVRCNHPRGLAKPMAYWREEVLRARALIVGQPAI